MNYLSFFFWFFLFQPLKTENHLQFSGHSKTDSGCLFHPEQVSFYLAMQGRILRARDDLLPGRNWEDHKHSKAHPEKPKAGLLQVKTLFS